MNALPTNSRQHHPTANHPTNEHATRIPVTPTSSLRRSGSFKATNSQYVSISHPTPAKIETRQISNAAKTLQRGYSFMERGERKKVAGTEPRRNAGAPVKTINGAPQTPTRIRSLSLSLNAANSRLNSPKSPTVASLPRTPPTSPDHRHQSYQDWDLESVTSNTSGVSVASCDHASVARNGTTFSGRSKRYMVHCSEHSGASGEDYLTPTQRAHQQVKRLKHLLQKAQKDLDFKDSDILKLTKEVVELRLYKAALSSPEDKSTSSNSGDAITVVENHDDIIDGDGVDNQNSSCADSGHYDDLSNSREDVGLSPYKSKVDKAITADLGPRTNQSEQQKLIVEYERRLQELIHTHEEECHQMKQRHNDKVEELLQRLSEVNARYWELVPDLDTARERIHELEQQLDEACKKLEEQGASCKEENKTTLVVPDPVQPDVANPSRISVPDLLHQLEVTQNELENVKDLEYVASSSNSVQPLLSAKEAVSLWVLGARKAMYRQLLEARNKNKIDPEITLQFLKSAIYYFLTDKENNQGHLRAIQNILGFTPIEISNIDKARLA